MKPNSKSVPCGNEDCDKCDPRPRWKISWQRLQRLTYTRKIKAATAEEAMQIFEGGTAWPSQYDDNYGDVVQLDAPVTEKLQPDEYHLTECCYHDLLADSLPVSGPDTLCDDKVPVLGVDPQPKDVLLNGSASLLHEQGTIGAEHLPCTIDRLEMVLKRMLEAMPEFEGGGPLVD